MIEQLFGSKTRVKLLKLFLNNPNRSFYVREITRKIDEQINSVRRELANLLSVGIIKSDKVDNKLYYEVNQKNDLYDAMQAMFVTNNKGKKKTKVEKSIKADQNSKSTEKASAQDNDLLPGLESLGALELVLLTGSFTRDDSAPIDLLIVGDVAQTRLNKFIKELEGSEGREILFTVMKLEELRYRLDVNDRFISRLLDGKYQVVIDKQSLL